MRTAVNIVRIFVGILFIISGLVKANDPLGLSYKMQEFFEVWNASLLSSSFFAKDFLINSFTFLSEYSLTLSVIMIGLEIMAGVALLVSWKKKSILTLLLLLIIFFTFLTAYAYWSGKFKNCGCFGDCLPISPLTSFIKDIVLLVMIIFLLAFQRYINPLISKKVQAVVLISSLLFTILFQWYVLNYLPVADCLPFKEGNNIPEQMKAPANAIQDSFALKFIYKKDGQKYEFAPEELPADLENYTFVDREQKLVRKGNAEPPIKGFALTDLNGNDQSQQILNEPAAILFFALNFDEVNSWISNLKTLHKEAQKRNIPLYVISSEAAKGKVILSSAGLPDVQVLNSDNTAIKTAARVNPTIFYLKNGTVVEKYSYRQTNQFINKL